MAMALFAASAVVTAGGTIYSAQQQRKGARAQQRVARLQRQRVRIEESRARRDAIRSARTARAAVLNSGANQGVLDSSGVAGGAASAISQGNANLSFLDQTARIADQASTEMGRVRKYQQNASMGQSVAQLGQVGMNVFSSGGQQLYQRIFNPGG